MVRFANVACVLACFSTGCTKPNPAYCESAADCEVGVCNEFHMCVELDAPVADQDATPDASTCEDRVAFLSSRDGVLQIYTMRADGADQVNLTRTSVDEGFAAGGVIRWSPMGDRLAYVRPTGLTMWAIWVIDADGNNHRSITSGRFDNEITWSPDGTRIAFSRTTDPLSSPTDIWAVDLSGGTPQRLTTTGANALPSWSPDGTQIAFVSNRGGDYEIYTVPATGGGEVQLTDNAFDDAGSSSSFDSAPAQWSSDGLRLMFGSYQPNRDISVMDHDGANQMRLTMTSARETHPRWFPDATKIVYMLLNPAGFYDLWVINSDGSAPTALDSLDADDSFPDVSSSGTRLVWQSDRDGNWEIYTANPNGTGVMRATNDAGDDTIPVWRPCP